jgi:NCAIR mutase (PurE)-related protein
MHSNLEEILKQVATQTLSVADAKQALQGIDELGFAQVDTNRLKRRKIGEIIFGAGKSAQEILQIAQHLFAHQDCFLATRVSSEQAQMIQNQWHEPRLQYDALGKCLWIEKKEALELPVLGEIMIVSAGTSDAAVAREAEITLKHLRQPYQRINDIGVAGLHRLINVVDRLREATVLIVIAGMEGALPSVVSGLVDCPVIAVPTSIGYGASFAGVSALLGMLNSCSSGISVVNIDNGFGAAYCAAQINLLQGKRKD